MSEPNRATINQQFAARLRQEAVATRPDFSAALHARIMDAVTQSCGTGSAINPCGAGSASVVVLQPPAAASSRRRTYAWRLVTTAACLLLMAGVAWHMHRAGTAVPGGGDSPVAAASANGGENEDLSSLSDLADTAAQNVGALVESAAATHQSALLGADVRLAADVFTESLSFDPADNDASQP
jgi:hypothetical protein